MDSNPGTNSSGSGQQVEIMTRSQNDDDGENSSLDTAGRLRNWLATGVFALAFLFALAAMVIIGYSALSGQALWNANNVIISLVVISGLFGIYPLTYLAYLGQRGASDRERLIDDFGLLGLEDKDKIEQTVRSLYRTVFNPAQYLIFIALILLISVIMVLAYISRNAIGFLNERALELAFFAFLGAYVFSVQELIRRFNTKDLLPQVYSSILGRMILAVTLTFVGAVIIELGAANLAEGSTDSTIPAWGAVVAFVIGIFPKRGMNWFSRRTEGVLQTAGRTQDDRPLEHIIGISPLHASRLNEMGIDDAQNLATADLRRLLLTTQFDTQQVVGWIDQAILYAKVGDLLDRFRDAKIGTFHELHTLVIDLDLFANQTPKQTNGSATANTTQQLLPLLGLGSMDQLRWLANYGNYPNYAHIAEYYYRKGKVARERAKLGMEGILGAQGILLVGTINPADPRVISRAEKEEYERRLRDLKRVLSHDHGNVDLLVQQGTLYYFLGRLEDAKAALRQALAHNADLAEAYYILSIIYLAQANQEAAERKLIDAEVKYNAAVRESTNALRINPNLAKAHVNRGLAYIQKEYFDLALQDLDQALFLDDRLPVAYLYRGIVYNIAGNWKQAVTEFETAHLLGHRVDLLWVSWGNALMRLEQYDEAVTKLTLAVQGDTDVASALAKRASIYILKGKAFYNQAEKDLVAAREMDATLPEVYGNLGLLERAKGNNQKAVEYYLQALGLDEDWYEARYNLARTYRSMGQFTDAQREFRQVLADAPVEDADSMRRDVHRDLGLIAFQMDDLATARQEFQQVLASIPDGAQDRLGREVHRDLGRIAYRLGEYEVAAEHFSQILSSAEADYEARYYLGLVHFRLGELNKAKAEFQRIVNSSDPALDESLSIDANQNLGLIAMGSSDPQSAKTYFLAALEIDPDNAPARYNLGLIYWNLGDKAAAEKEFARIVDTGSAGGELVEQAKRNLAELKKPDKSKTVQDDPISEKPEKRTPEAK